MSNRFPRTTAAAVMTAALIACNPEIQLPTVPPAALAEVVAPPVTLEWQKTARDLVAQRSLSPLAAGRLFAAVNMAAMQAVAAVDAQTDAAGGRTGDGYGPGGRSRYEARRGAVAGASARVLSWFVPTSATALDDLVGRQGNAGPGNVHPQFTIGVAIGRAAADAILAHVAADGFTAPWTGTVPVGPGLWTTSTLPPLASCPGTSLPGS